MKQKKNSRNGTPTTNKLNALLVKLESAHNALKEHRNFNLAEVHLLEYFKEQPPAEQTTGYLFDALKERDSELLLAAVEAEIERLRTEKIKLLREDITQS